MNTDKPMMVFTPRAYTYDEYIELHGEKSECDECFGSGFFQCELCDGEGELDCPECSPSHKDKECSICKGEIVIECFECKGECDFVCEICKGEKQRTYPNPQEYKDMVTKETEQFRAI